MKTFCPHCEKTAEVDVVKKCEKVTVRGELFEVNSRFLKCRACKEEFDDRETGGDSLEQAYCEYRRKHGMLQPAEIAGFRQRYGLTQAELANLLGWGAVTLSRYETGALQSEAHDRVLRMLERPDILLELIRKGPEDAFPQERRAELLDKLTDHAGVLLEELFVAATNNYKPSIFSGHACFDFQKFAGACLFLAKGGVWKTKLNKLLFYSDFLHYRGNGKAITGLCYAAADFGPVPDNYELLYSLLIKRGALKTEEICFPDGSVGEKIVAVHAVDLKSLTEPERKTLARVKDAFFGFTAKQITEYSHKEPGYLATESGGLISYEHANGTSLPES